jgi:hypothetical protein
MPMFLLLSGNKWMPNSVYYCLITVALYSMVDTVSWEEDRLASLLTLLSAVLVSFW